MRCFSGSFTLFPFLPVPYNIYWTGSLVARPVPGAPTIRSNQQALSLEIARLNPEQILFRTNFPTLSCPGPDHLGKQASSAKRQRKIYLLHGLISDFPPCNPRILSLALPSLNNNHILDPSPSTSILPNKSIPFLHSIIPPPPSHLTDRFSRSLLHEPGNLADKRPSYGSSLPSVFSSIKQ